MNGPKVHREPLLSAMAGSASGYMLEHLENPVILEQSENSSGADNQQERLSADQRSESSEAIRRISSDSLEDDMVRAAWRHAEVSGTRNDSSVPIWDVTRLSEIPCRVSQIARGGSDPDQLTGSNRWSPPDVAGTSRVIPRVRSSNGDPRNDSGCEIPGWSRKTS